MTSMIKWNVFECPGIDMEIEKFALLLGKYFNFTLLICYVVGVHVIFVYDMVKILNRMVPNKAGVSEAFGDDM